jgi:mannosyltransferase
MVKKGHTTQTKKTDRLPSRADRSAVCDLDGGYSAGISSFRDITPHTLKEILIKSRYAQILIILTAIGLVIRFYHLDYNSLWLDESMTYQFSLHPFSEYWDLISRGGEVHPPLLYWLEYFMLFFGNNEFNLRFIPAIIGTATIPLTYSLGKEILDRNVGIIAAGLLTFSSFHILYSQEARMYSLLLFFITLALIYFLRALRSDSNRPWIIFGICSGLAFWTHFYAIIIIGFLFLFAVGVHWNNIRQNIRNIRPIILSAGVFLIISLPLIIVAVPLFFIRTGSTPTWGYQGMELIISTFQQFSGNNPVLMVIFILLFICGIIQIFRVQKRISILIISLFLIAFGMSYALSFFMPMSPRYLIFLLTLFFVAIAAVYQPLCVFFNTKKVVYIFLIGMIIITIPSVMDYYSRYTKDDWRSVSQRITVLSQPGDIIVPVPDYNHYPLDYYYNSTTDGTREIGASGVTGLEQIYTMENDRKIFYVVTGDIYAADPTGESLQWLKGHARTMEAYPGIYLLIS